MFVVSVNQTQCKCSCTRLVDGQPKQIANQADSASSRRLLLADVQATEKV